MVDDDKSLWFHREEFEVSVTKLALALHSRTEELTNYERSNSNTVHVLSTTSHADPSTS